jgi:hypothetical protein
MKIKAVRANPRRKMLEIQAGVRVFPFPYSKLDPPPAPGNPLVEVWPDMELGCEGFSWRLKDGREGTLHLDAVMEENRDPALMADLLLHKLSVEADRRRKDCGLSNRELIRRMGTSASQYYRLLDPANTGKSMKDLITLLGLLGCDVELVLTPRPGGKGSPR